MRFILSFLYQKEKTKKKSYDGDNHENTVYILLSYTRLVGNHISHDIMMRIFYANKF